MIKKTCGFEVHCSEDCRASFRITQLNYFSKTSISVFSAEVKEACWSKNICRQNENTKWVKDVHFSFILAWVSVWVYDVPDWKVKFGREATCGSWTTAEPPAPSSVGSSFCSDNIHSSHKQ